MSGPYPADQIPDHLHAVFPDWAPFEKLEEAARAYLRDPEVALSALRGVLGDATVLGFTLERYINDVGAVWQEVALCDDNRLLVWHGEDMPGETGAMTSSVRVIPLSTVAEVGFQDRLVRSADGSVELHGLDVYVLMPSIYEINSTSGETAGESNASVRHESLRFVKSLDDGGPEQIRRLREFVDILAGLLRRGRAAAPQES